MEPPVVARSRRAGACLREMPQALSRRRQDTRKAETRLKRRYKEKKRMPRLVSANCFGICPKKAVVLASGRSLQDDQYLLVSRPRQVEAALERLLPPDRPESRGKHSAREPELPK